VPFKANYGGGRQFVGKGGGDGRLELLFVGDGGDDGRHTVRVSSLLDTKDGIRAG